MRRLFPLWILLLIPAPLFAQTGALQGFCNRGGQTALTSGLSSTNFQQQIINSCTVTVYLSGTTTLATIYSDKTGTPLSNPFTADAAGSVFPGHWIFFANNTVAYDVAGSGGIAPNTYPSPVPLCTDCFPSTQLTLQMNLQHNSSATNIDQNLYNLCDNGSCGPSLDQGMQQVVAKTGTNDGSWVLETLATNTLAPFSNAPIAGQHAIAYPTGFSTTCATGSNTTGKTVVTNGGCNSMVTWTFSAPGGNITTTSGATIPIANVTAVYPFVTSAATIQSGNATPANFFETTCTGTGVTLDVTQQGEQSGTLTFPLHQYTSSTSLTVSLANYNAMTCDISASEIDGSVGTPNIVNGSATVVGAYIYYTGSPVSSPNQIYVQGPLNFDTTTNILSLPLPYDVAFDFGVSGTTYAIQNSNFTSAVAGLKTTFCAANANTTTAPTLNMNGWGAWTIFGPTGGALSLNDITPCAGASGTGQMINVQLTQTAAGMQWWLQNPKTASGSAITGSGTANTLTKWTAANAIGNSSVTDDGTTPTRIPDSIDTNAIYREYTVDTGGVTGGQALCVTGNLDGGGQPKVLACPTTGHGAGFVGIAYQNALAGGLALACWSVGCSALFDGSVTQRDTAIVSTTTAGDLHDTGVTTAPGGENLVVNIAGPNTGAGTRALINITGATPAGGGGGGLPSGVFGQVPTNSGASAGSYLAQSPTVGVANGGAAITTSYTLLCDSATVSVGIQDRGKWAVVGSGGSVTVPDLAGTGCSGFYGGVENSTSGAVTVSRQTSDTFNVYGPTQGAPTTGQTSFSLPAGSWATFNPSTTATVYDVRIGTPPASSGSGLSGMTAGQVPIAATATTVTSSKALAGTGAGITTGPTTTTLNDCVKFGDTAGTLADAGAACGSGSGSGYTNLTGSGTQTTIAAINSACGSGTFYATTPLSIATGGTVTCPVQFIGAGIWTIATGQTVTFSKSVAETDGPNQIFAGPGTVLLSAATPYDYPEWFGAKGDGTTDDSAAIQAAINAVSGGGAAGTNVGTGSVHLLAKTYLANSTLNINVGGVKLIGVGINRTANTAEPVGEATALKTTSATITQVSIQGTSGTWIVDNGIHYVEIERTTQPTTNATAVNIQYAYETTIDHVSIHDSIRGFYLTNVGAGSIGAIENTQVEWTTTSACVSGPYYGLYIDYSGGGITPSLRIRNSGVGITACASSYAVYVNGNPQDIHIRHLEAGQVGYGVYIAGAGGAGTHTDNHFQDMILDQCQVSCYYINNLANNPTGAAQVSVSIDGGWADGNSSTAPVVDIEGSGGVMVNGVSIYNNQQSGIGVKIGGGFGNSVNSNNILNIGASGTGILLSSTGDNTVSNNQIHGASATSTRGVSLTASSRNYLTGNTMSGDLAIGASFDATSNNNDLYNVNQIDPTGITTPISNSGTNNIVSIMNNPMTTLGDTIYGGTGGAATRIAGNTSATTECLTQTGTGTASAAPAWGSCSGTGGSIVLENGGSSLGAITTLNCSTGSNCTAASGTGTLTVTGGNYINLGGTVTWTGCTYSGGACAVSGSTTTTVTISSIPSGYVNLHVIVYGSSTASTGTEDVGCQFNGDTGSNYGGQRFFGNNSTVAAGAQTSQTSVFCAELPISGGVGSTSIDVPLYANTTFPKSFTGTANMQPDVATSGSFYQLSLGGVWKPSVQAAITSIKFIIPSNDFTSGTSFLIYGTN